MPVQVDEDEDVARGVDVGGGVDVAQVNLVSPPPPFSGVTAPPPLGP